MTSRSLEEEFWNGSPGNTTTPSGGVGLSQSESDLNKRFNIFIEYFSEYFIIFIVLTFVLLWITSKIYAKILCVGSDPADLKRISISCINCINLWTGILVCIALYLERNDASHTLFESLWKISLAFIGLNIIFSILMALYCTNDWQNGNRYHNSVIEYSQKHSAFVIFMTFLIGFYPTLNLIRSKLFYINALYLPLKKDEFERLNKFRFLGVGLLLVT